MPVNHDLRRDFELSRFEMRSERESFMPRWRDLARFILPTRPRFESSDNNKGRNRFNDILDCTAGFAARTLRSGMMSSVTNPTRPWFRLSLELGRNEDSTNVQSWLHDSTEIMRNIFLRSNLYAALLDFYYDLGVFATAAIFMEEDFDDVVRFRSLPVGSYMVSTNANNRVNTFAREFRMTVRQVMDRFAQIDPGSGKIVNLDEFSSATKNAYKNKRHEQWVDIVHSIIPNVNYIPDDPRPDRKRFISAYYEAGQSGGGRNRDSQGETNDGKLLRVRGYDWFPVLFSRWDAASDDIYGTNCPGMLVLGDVKQLQVATRRGLQALELMVKPPVQAPVSMRSTKVSSLPGDISYVDQMGQQQGGIRPLYEVRPNTAELEAMKQALHNRIDRGFFVDLWLQISQLEGQPRTATEIEERREEKLIALGPVLERLNNSLLDPLIENTYLIAERQGVMPEAPTELEGEQIRIEYVSIMAQAVKAAGLGSIERLSAFTGQVAAAHPDALDKVNADRVIEVYADMSSVPPDLIRSDEEVEEMRQQRQQAQKAQEKMAAIQQGAGAAKDLAKADLGGDSMLSNLAGGGL